MSKPKLALLKQSSRSYGGLEKQTLGLIQEITSRGYSVDLLTQGPCHFPNIKHLTVYPLCRRKALSYFSLKTYIQECEKWLKENRYSHILGLERHKTQTHYRAGSGIHRYFLEQRLENSSLLKRSLLKANPFHKLVLDLEEATFGSNGAKRIYCNSQMVIDQAKHYYQTDPQRLMLIQNGIEWEKSQEPFNKRLERKLDSFEKLGLNLDSRYLLFLGNGYERKGLKTALRALSLSNSSFQLLVAGKDSRLNSYKSFAKQLGLCKRVHWLKNEHSPSDLYMVSEALILPTLYDPSSNVVLEALSLGLYILGSSHDGSSLNLDLNHGQALDPLKQEPWKDAIDRLWKAPLTTTQSISARESVRHLEWKNQLKRLVDDFLAHEPTTLATGTLAT